MIIDQVEGLKRLVNEFSSYARMPAPNLAMNDIKQIVEESVSLYKETQKGVEIVFHDTIEVPPFRVDREQMKRMMINLLDNAIDAIEKEGHVEVQLFFDRDRQVVTIEVADDGQGIPPEHRARVFEPYFSTKKHGTGLGLAIAKEIIRRHGGKIEVQSSGVPGEGTTFMVWLPVSE